MADLTALQQADTDLKAAVSAAVADMDKLFSDLQAALAANNQPAIDAVTADIQNEINALKAATAADPAP